jgi:glycosyltransferase involved in cell wall biosynthesis
MRKIKRIILPFLGRWQALNYGRFQQILTRCASKGIEIHIFQPPPSTSMEELSFKEKATSIPEKIFLHTVEIPARLWNMQLPANKLLKKGIYSILTAKAIQKFTKDGDVIFWYNFPHFLLIKNKTPKIFDFADDMLAMLKQELGILYNPFIMKFAEVMLKQMLKHSFAVTVISSVLFDKIKQGNSKTFLLPNGADINEFKVGEPSRCSVNFPKGSKVIGYIGTLEYFVDIKLIANTIKELTEFNFLIIAAGRKLKELKKYKERMSLHNLYILPPVLHNELRHYLAIMDACWLPFRKCPVANGATPIKIFEYALMKKPIISTTLEEVVRIGNNFINFADNVEETAKVARDISLHYNKYSHKVEIGYKLVKEKYSWDRITDNFISIIELNNIRSSFNK